MTLVKRLKCGWHGMCSAKGAQWSGPGAGGVGPWGEAERGQEAISGKWEAERMRGEKSGLGLRSMDMVFNCLTSYMCLTIYCSPQGSCYNLPLSNFIPYLHRYLADQYVDTLYLCNLFTFTYATLLLWLHYDITMTSFLTSLYVSSSPSLWLHSFIIITYV